MESCEQGYEDDRFENAVSQNFHCPICMNVFKEPVMCRRNQHCFCRPCITRHLKNSQTCPTCKEELTSEILNQAPRIFKDCLSELNIRCEYFSRGCREFVQLGDLDSHVKNCGFSPAMCSNQGCLVEINKRDRTHHETEICEFRKVKCHDCSELRKDMDEMKMELTAVKNSLQEMQMNYTAVKNNLQEMQVNNTAMNNNLQEMQMNYTAVKNNLQEMQINNTAMKNNLQEMQVNYTAVKNSLQEMQMNLMAGNNETKTNLNALSDKLAYIEDIKLTTIKNKIDLMKASITTEVSKEVRTINLNCWRANNEMKTNMTALKNQMEKSGMVALNNDVKANMAALNEMKQNMTATNNEMYFNSLAVNDKLEEIKINLRPIYTIRLFLAVAILTNVIFALWR